VRPFPRPARRARAVSAAFGRCDHPPSTEARSKRPLQLLPLPRSSRWRLMRATPQYVYQPHRPYRPGSHRRSSLPPDFVHRCARQRTHARTACSRLRCGAGCRDCLCCTNRALHVGLSSLSSERGTRRLHDCSSQPRRSVLARVGVAPWQPRPARLLQLASTVAP